MAEALEFTVSDVQITRIDAEGTKTGEWFPAGEKVQVRTSITIFNENDDDAKNIRVVVVLPPTSRVTATTPWAEIGPANGPATSGEPWETNGYVMFSHPHIPDLGTGQTFEMALETDMLDRFPESPITAFVYGDRTDPNPANNCRTAKINVGG